MILDEHATHVVSSIVGMYDIMEVNVLVCDYHLVYCSTALCSVLVHQA
jgi:hypothetical protein